MEGYMRRGVEGMEVSRVNKRKGQEEMKCNEKVRRVEQHRERNKKVKVKMGRGNFASEIRGKGHGRV